MKRDASRGAAVAAKEDSPGAKAGVAVWVEDAAARSGTSNDSGALVIVQPRRQAVPKTRPPAGSKPGDAPFTGMSFKPIFENDRVSVIRARMEAGKEFVFSADLSQAGGTFKTSKSAKAGACWTSDADSPTANRKDNFVELEFAPLPSVDYRCWVYVGACCGETFEFSYRLLFS